MGDLGTILASIGDIPTISIDHILACALTPAIIAVPPTEGDTRLKGLGVPTH